MSVIPRSSAISSDDGKVGCLSLEAHAFTKHLKQAQHSAILTILQKCDKIFIRIELHACALNL
jgi:hypothetical protein